MKKVTQLVIAPKSGSGEGVYSLLVAETGQGLCSHYCSDSKFAPGDLYHNRSHRIEEYVRMFGEVDVKFINELEITQEELLRRNQAWHNVHNLNLN